MISEGVDNLFDRIIIQSIPLRLSHHRQKMSSEFLRKTKFLEDESDVLRMMDKYRKYVLSVMKYGLKVVMSFHLVLYVKKMKQLKSGGKTLKSMMF